MKEFLDIIKSKLGAGYVYGGQSDKPLTGPKLIALVNTFGRARYYFNGFSAEKWLGKEYYDCSGLIVFALTKLGLITGDYSAHDLYHSLCTPVSKTALEPGDWCFVKSDGRLEHVGVYMGNNKVIHARGTKYGVVETDLLSSFTVFGRCKLLKKDLTEPTYEENLRVVADKLGIDYNYWVSRKTIDRYFEAFIKKNAEYIRGLKK